MDIEERAGARVVRFLNMGRRDESPSGREKYGVGIGTADGGGCRTQMMQVIGAGQKSFAFDIRLIDDFPERQTILVVRYRADDFVRPGSKNLRIGNRPAFRSCDDGEKLEVVGFGAQNHVIVPLPCGAAVLEGPVQRHHVVEIGTDPAHAGIGERGARSLL